MKRNLHVMPGAEWLALLCKHIPGVIRRIPHHLELWAPLPSAQNPPLGPASWPRYAGLQLIYHPLPAIA